MRTSSPPYVSRLKNKDKQGITLSLGYPLLFHWLASCLVLVLLLISAVMHLTPLLAISIFLLVLTLVARLWSWQSLPGVSCDVNLSQSRAFPGEKVALSLVVSNSKWLPLPWLEVEAELPYRLVTGRIKTPSPYVKERLRWAMSVSGGQRVRWKHQLECRARGDYRLGPVRLRSGDIFGFFPREVVLPCFARVLVYPRINPVSKLGLPLKELFGESDMPRSIYEDASRTMGARDYRFSDPFKRIHWTASARFSQLQSRQYESTTSLSLLLILDVYSFCQPEPEKEESFEQAVTTVASLAYQAHRENYSVGLMANSIPEIQIPVHGGHSQLLLLLEALARVEARANLPLHEQLHKTWGDLPIGATLVIVTSVPTHPLTGLVRKLEQEGHSLVLVGVGQQIQVSNFGAAPAASRHRSGVLPRGWPETQS